MRLRLDTATPVVLFLLAASPLIAATTARASQLTGHRLSLTLRAGRYVLICDRRDHGSHYRQGMFAAFTVP